MKTNAILRAVAATGHSITRKQGQGTTPQGKWVTWHRWEISGPDGNVVTHGQNPRQAWQRFKQSPHGTDAVTNRA